LWNYYRNTKICGTTIETPKLKQVDQTTGNNLNTETAKEKSSLTKTDDIAINLCAYVT
jgi:hypothetical protein